MQRASSLSSLKSKSTASPNSTTYPSPKTQDQVSHPAKRVKTSHSAGYSPATPGSVATPLSATSFAVRRLGSQADNEGGDAALTPRGGEEGETKWFFSFRAEDDANVGGGLKVEVIGAGSLAEDGSDTEQIEAPPWTEDQGVGRRVFGVDTDRWARNRARPNGRVSVYFYLGCGALECRKSFVAYSILVSYLCCCIDLYMRKSNMYFLYLAQSFIHANNARYSFLACPAMPDPIRMTWIAIQTAIPPTAIARKTKRSMIPNKR